MHTLRRLCFSVFTLALVASVLPASAETTWDQVKSKVSGAKAYEVIYKYNGPQGIYDFDYRWGGPDHIRTEITSSKSDPSKKGTVIVYDKSWKADQVRAKTGGGVITRNLTHKDVQGRPFHTSLYGMILDQVKGLGKPVASKDGNRTKFKFGNQYTIWASAEGDIVKTERKDGKTPEVREFTNVKWNGSPATGF